MLKRRSLWTLALSSTLAVGSGAAWADAHEEGGEGDMGEEGGGGGEAMGGSVAATAEAGGYPLRNLDRPLTIPKGTINPMAMIDASKLGDDTGVGLTIGAMYGVTDKIEVGFNYPIGISPEFQEEHAHFGLHAAYSAIDEDKLDLAATLNTFHSFDTFKFHMFGIGPATRFKLNDKMAVFGGENLIQYMTMSIPNPLGGDDISISPLAAVIDVGFGFQANDNLLARVDTTLAWVALNDDAGDTQTIADATPLMLRGFYSLDNKMDIIAGFGFDDLQNAGDTWGVTVGVSYRMLK